MSFPLNSDPSTVNLPVEQTIPTMTESTPSREEQLDLQEFIRGGVPVTSFCPISIARIKTNAEACKIVREHLALLLHALKCRKSEANGEMRRECSLPECAMMIYILNHMTNCSTNENCRGHDCYVSKQVLYHWRCCEESNCPICVPVIQAQEMKTKDTTVPTILLNKHLNPSPSEMKWIYNILKTSHDSTSISSQSVDRDIEAFNLAGSSRT